jgi:hypothetical protein
MNGGARLRFRRLGSIVVGYRFTGGSSRGHMAEKPQCPAAPLLISFLKDLPDGVGWV